MQKHSRFNYEEQAKESAQESTKKNNAINEQILQAVDGAQK